MSDLFLGAPVDTLDPRQSNRVFLPPAADATYLRADNNLRLTVFNSASGVELALRTRILLPDGHVQTATERCVPASNRTASTFTIQTGEGWLLGATLLATVGTARIGQCFAVLDVVRGDSAAALVVATILQGYVTDTSRLAFPGSPIRSSIDGPGVLRTVTGTDPAAGAEILESVPTNARWRVLAATFTLTTDATAANREVAVALDDGPGVVARAPSGFTQTASLAITYSTFYQADRNVVATDATRNVPFPRVDLVGGMRWRTITTNIQAGDNYGAPIFLVEEWIED